MGGSLFRDFGRVMVPADDPQTLTMDCVSFDSLYVWVYREEGGCPSYELDMNFTALEGEEDTEPNGELSEAIEFSGGEKTGYLGMKEKDGEEDLNDMYKLNLEGPGSVEVIFSIEHSGVAEEGSAIIELDAIGSNGLSVLGSGSTSSKDTLYISCLEEDFIYLDLTSSAISATCANYKIQVNPLIIQTADDGYDPDTGTLPLGANETKEGRIGYRVPGESEEFNDQDLYTFKSEDKEVYRISLSPEYEHQILGLAVYQGISLIESVSSADFENNEATILLSCYALDEYFVQVINVAGCGGYMLTTETTGHFSYAHDTEDGSDTPVSGALGSPYQGQLGRIYSDILPDFMDNYDFVTTVPSTLRFVANTGDENVGDMEFFVEQNDALLGELTLGPGLSSEFLIECMNPDSVFVTITGDCGSYEFILEEVSTAPGNDNEPNDVMSSAVPLSLNHSAHATLGYLDYSDAGLSEDQVDYFTISANQSGTLSLPFRLDPPDAEMKAEHLDENGNVQATWTLFNGTVMIFEYPEPGKTHFIRVYSDGLEDCVNYSLTPTFGTGYSGQNAESIRIFPNPARDFLTIEGEGELQIEILDLAGKVWYRNVLESGKTEIELSEWNPGSYILRIESENAQRMERLVIK
jgi:hypothetical protein